MGASAYKYCFGETNIALQSAVTPIDEEKDEWRNTFAQDCQKATESVLSRIGPAVPYVATAIATLYPVTAPVLSYCRNLYTGYRICSEISRTASKIETEIGGIQPSYQIILKENLLNRNPIWTSTKQQTSVENAFKH